MPQVIIDTSGSEDKPYRAYLSGVDTRAITWVTLVCLVGVEVSGGTGGGRVPLSVNIVLGISVPKLVVVFSVFEVKLGGHTGVGGGHEGGGRCHEGEGNNLGQLFRNGERKKILDVRKKVCKARSSISCSILFQVLAKDSEIVVRLCTPHIAIEEVYY